MIHLRLDGGPSSAPVATLGPAPWFRIAGNFIRQGPYGAIMGTFRHHVWEVHARQYVRYSCTEPHLLCFEDAAGGEGLRLGPFSYTWGEDGLLHPDSALRGKFHPDRQLWHEFASD